MSSAKKLMGTTAVGGGALAIEDVFSTYLYTGNGSTQTITNGIDLAGEGGLVWIKNRSTALYANFVDTERGDQQRFVMGTGASIADVDFGTFLSDGFSLDGNNQMNTSGSAMASWTWRRAPRFFDVVQYTGTGVARTIPHNLGVEPGCIIVKRVDSTSSWTVYHRGNNATAPEDYAIFLNATGAASTGSSWNYTAHTDTDFSVGTLSGVNSNGATYVAYLFAHDPLGPSGDGSDGLIACGSYTGNGNENTITLGFEPQFVMIKRTNSTSNWSMFDNMRGFSVTSSNALRPNTSGSELDYGDTMQPLADGFKIVSSQTDFNASGGTYIYIAIRRGPMRQPTSGTEVFNLFKTNAGIASSGPAYNFADMLISARRTTTYAHRVVDRLRGVPQVGSTGYYLDTTAIDAEASYTGSIAAGSSTDNTFASVNNALYAALGGTGGGVSYAFKRAPGFFDVVAYTGTGANPQTHKHNLGVAPEMIIIKRRDSANDWIVYHSGNDVDGDGQPWTDYLRLDSTQAGADAAYFSDYQPTSVDFQAAGFGQTGASGGTYIAYLFATLPGVSKVGSYTGNGSSQTIDCGFTSGARFILIKRTDSTGDWYVWDTERGIVTGNDPHLSLNTTAAEVTTDDSIDPDSSGFIVNQVAATNVNVSSASYIFYAIA